VIDSTWRSYEYQPISVGLSERPKPIRSGATLRPGSCGMMFRQRNEEVGSPCSSSVGLPSPSST
jgi:hypothetical protein